MLSFLVNIIKSNGTIPNNSRPVLKLNTTTPNPFRNLTHLYTNHKTQPLDKTFMKPGTTPEQYEKQLIQGRGTLQTPTYTKTTTTTTTSYTTSHPTSSTHNNNKVFSHSQIIELDLPYLIHNRTK
jgi:hypothetical protein